MEFGFFRGLPKNLFFLDIAGQVAFLLDIILQFFVTYRDSHSYKMVYNRNLIALRYLKSHFFPDLLGCMPWDIIFKRMEKDIRINYLFTRIVKLITVELYCTHTAACIFYYLATTLPEEKEGYTWIGSLQLGDYSYAHFREIDIWKRYTTSLYFAIVTMATVGYGDIHAVNLREMIFIMIYVSFDMILGAYLIGNMTALIVKGSKTERYRDKMTDLIKYMNRNRLGKNLRNQIKGHLRLQYESSYTDASVLQDIPISIRAKISQTLYKSYVENVPLFKGCSSEFINQIVTRVHEEFFLPGEEEVGIGADGSEDTVSPLEPNSLFGEISILCNIPQPYTILHSISGNKRAELALRVNSAAYYGDLYQLKSLIRSGADPNKKDYDGRSALNSKHKRAYGRCSSEQIILVSKGDTDLLRRVLANGIDPNSKDYDIIEPLSFSAISRIILMAEVAFRIWSQCLLKG
ncbi:UNVERIFIED_CONTAM: Potassium channel SKOR [Sesamum calycinum]|uniref:Potassium channel SKOR n=1 Tax=Sesamum calycinum TaxID=2727403 RepID=A0AAW2SWC5_9LAMI